MNVLLMFILVVHSSLSFDENFQIDLGKDVTFSCLFPNQYQINEVSFIHQTNGEVLSLGLELIQENSRLKLIQFSSNRLDMKIKSVSENDSGVYTCFINDDELSSFILQVLIPPEFIWYYPKEASLSYPEGSSLNLSCRAFAIPSVNITWIYRDQYQQSKIIHQGEDIYISSLKWSSNGLYECVASNGYHSTINRSFYVTIQYSPRLIKHEIINRNKTTIEFLCELCSIPLSNIQWIKNDRILSNNQHVSINIKLNDQQQCFITKLFLRNVTNEKYGRYECRAENSLGHHSHHFDFYPKIISKSRFENHRQLSYLTEQNQTKSFSNSSKYFFNKSSLNLFIIFILIIYPVN